MNYRFGSLELDTTRFELRVDGQVRPIEPQVFALLALLVENRERLVSRDEIIEKVWDRRIVSEAAVSSRIKSARRAIGDDGRAQRLIKTIHGRGFRFVADVKTLRGETALPAPLEAARAEAPLPQAPRDSEGRPLRPSIAVLPFRLVGGAGPCAAIADALPDELITDLSRLRWLFVTARASSFRLRAAEPDPCEVGSALGVRYVLTGSLEVAGARLEVAVELVDTRDGGVVWAERFAAAIGDVHRVREEIRARILVALELRIPLHEASLARLRATEDLDAWSAYHVGLQHLYRFNHGDNAAAAALFRQALARDPGFARAHAGLSFVHFQTAFMRYTDEFAGEAALARRAAERGLELDPLDPFVHFTMGRSFWLEGDLEGSLAWLERATAISPSYAQGIYARAWAETLAGRAEDGRAHVDLAMRLSPLDPLYYAMLATRALTHMTAGEDAEAAAWSERAARSPGAHRLIAVIAAAAQGLAGDATGAAAWAAAARRADPALTREDFFRSFPMKSDPMKARVSDALLRLGF